MDAGTVTAIGPGAATITATITVEGVEYSDTCSIEVEAAEDVVYDLTAAANWNDATQWYKQDYQQTERGTYIEYVNTQLQAVTNPEGSSTTLYADISPLAGSVEYDANYNYYLEVEGDNAAANTYQLNFAGANASIFTGENTNIETQGAYSMKLPLTLAVEGASRLITIQIRKDTVVNADPPLTVKMRIVREPK